VPAGAAIYAAFATLVLGLAGGLLLGREEVVQRWIEPAPVVAPQMGKSVVDRPPAMQGGAALTVVDRAGRKLHVIPADRPWTPRFSPDGRRVAFGAYGDGRRSSDLWVTNPDVGTIRRLTEGTSDANDPQWGPDGESIAYSARAPGGKDVVLPLNGTNERVLLAREGTQFPSDWVRDGGALLVTEQTAHAGHDILVQPVDGSSARPYVATAADETTARMSPDGRWVAYTSNASGRPEVYLDAYPRPGRRVLVSSGGGAHPVWRGDGRELYYWRNGELVAVTIVAAADGAPPSRGAETVLFRAPYPGGVSTMYDVSPDGQRFVIARQP
jgi:dipeptidyl aminopeptidase/acylaminoacyl peptidase